MQCTPEKEGETVHHSLDPAMLLFVPHSLNPEHRRDLKSTVHTHPKARCPFGNSTLPQFSCYPIWMTATYVILRVSSMWLVNETTRTMFSATPRSSEMDAATTLIRTPRYASPSSRAGPAFGASTVRPSRRQKAIHVPEDPIQADPYARCPFGEPARPIRTHRARLCPDSRSKLWQTSNGQGGER